MRVDFFNSCAGGPRWHPIATTDVLERIREPFAFCRVVNDQAKIPEDCPRIAQLLMKQDMKQDMEQDMKQDMKQDMEQEREGRISPAPRLLRYTDPVRSLMP